MGAGFLQPEEKVKDKPNYSVPNGRLYTKQSQVLTGAKWKDERNPAEIRDIPIRY